MPHLKKLKKQTPFQELIQTVSIYDHTRNKVLQMQKQLDILRSELGTERANEFRHRGHILALLQLPELIEDAEKMEKAGITFESDQEKAVDIIRTNIEDLPSIDPGFSVTAPSCNDSDFNEPSKLGMVIGTNEVR